MGCGTSQNKAKNITSKTNTNEKKEFSPAIKENEKVKEGNLVKEIKKEIMDVKVIYKFNDGKIEIRTFKSDTSIDVIIKEAEASFLTIFTKLQLILSYEGKDLKELAQKKLEDLLEKDKNEIKIKIKFEGLPISQDIIKEFAKINLIAKPLYDSAQIAIYDKQNEKVTVVSDNIHFMLKNFNYTSSVCNGADSLFLSGGEYEENGERIISSSFLEYNLITLSAHLVENENGLVYPRKLHSMIYIPHNFVFIVGGFKMLKVEYYDIKKKTLQFHSDLNEEKVEPALCLINNNMLYAFSGSNNKPSFERINLRIDSLKWENINVEIEGQVLNFTQMFFAVTYFKEDSVIFLGGIDVEEKKNNYAYDYNKNTLFLTDKEKNEYEFDEKYFIPIEKSSGVAIPNFTERDFKLLVWNNESLQKAEFYI